MTDLWRHGVLRAGAAATNGSVVKFGGSLLARPSWPDDVLTLARSADGPVTIVVGGGSIVDGLRRLDEACPMPADASHRLAIDAMRITARLVSDRTPWAIVDSPPACGIAILDVAAWLARAAAMPVGWHVTSDSIAAAVATATGATLLLAKSVEPPGDDLHGLAANGWVDPYFPDAAAGLQRIAWAVPSG